MNRRQKIIVSVTGIFIVLLILIGLTYAYFLTRITGNSNPTSISVTTANLELVYGDGTTAILTSSNPLMPSSTPIGTKDFTVTNNGDDSEYVVVFEDVTVKYAADTVINGQAVAAGTDTTFESNDFVYTLTCEVKDKSGNILSDKSCDGVDNETFPMDGGIVLGNSIDKDDVHNYVLTLYYLDNGLDQSADMNKALNGKVNIKDIKSINPYSENTESLAYNIINNSILNKNGTMLVATPPSKVAEEQIVDDWEFSGEDNLYLDDVDIVGYASSEDLLENCYIDAGDCSGVKEYTSCTDDVKGKYIFDDWNYETNYVYDCENGKPVIGTVRFEKVLSTTIDDYGTSYYFRGNVKDNYVNFAGMCWRIVRIAGDGSIKLILEDKNTTCNNETFTREGTIGYGNFGYDLMQNKYYESGVSVMNYLNPSIDAENSMVKVFYDFQTTGKLKDYTDKLKSGNWCLSDKAYKAIGEYPNYTFTPLEEIDYFNIDDGEVYYDSYVRLYGNSNIGYKPTLKCTGTVLNNFSNVKNGDVTITTDSPMYVGALTADEVVYAGGQLEMDFKNYYLLSGENGNFYTLSPVYINQPGEYFATQIEALSSSGIFTGMGVDGYSLRPAVNLKANNIIASGDGTQSNPYVVE